MYGERRLQCYLCLVGSACYAETIAECCWSEVKKQCKTMEIHVYVLYVYVWCVEFVSLYSVYDYSYHTPTM